MILCSVPAILYTRHGSSSTVPAAAAASYTGKVVAITDDDTIKVIHAGQPERDYNYNANQKLVDAIREGYGGAYWDILRRSVRAR